MKRRNFLIGATAITLAEFLAGCEGQGDLNIQLLKNTIPAQMVSKFKRELTSQPKLNFNPQENLTELFSLLQSWQRKLLLEEQKSSTEQTNINIANLVTLGDYWLANAIKQELIQPLNSEALQNWNKLPEKWQKLVKRNNQGYADPQGKIWAAPYQWGTTLIAYRVDKFKTLGWQPTDWSDLWREELRHRFSLLNQPREVIGLTLKKLGKSYNVKNLSKVENLKSELVKLNQQVKYYASNNYLQSLITGDTWLAVGWSNDILPLVKTRKDIAAVIPKSGTALWSNLWVKPAATVETSLTEKWIDFCWEPQIAEQMSLITQTTSPIIPGINPTELTSEIKDNSLLLPPEDILEKSDFLYPLGDSTIQQYRQLWQEIRLSVEMKSG
ncbi:MAG: extracellular solute-binding protein [Okeania sp. SIO2C2]|uniref:extracellular solute-binding protein n=1 Tax=Okeania sp. SIO2C2 TaxID=2607787 RepID=UPI0013BB844A|nr:extracellular solute-binding protein [Okeania sp. SIO2C2]NEP87985.1 extracellular solute-binding protein [Okeania sp. SIO2C2]